MSSLVTAELGTKENPHPFSPKPKDRIKSNYYIYKNELRYWNGWEMVNKERLREYERNRRKTPRFREKRKEYQKSEKCKEYHREYRKTYNWRKKHPDKYEASKEKRRIPKEIKLKRSKERCEIQRKKSNERSKKKRDEQTLEQCIHYLVYHKKYDARVKKGRIKCEMTEELIMKLWEKQKGICALSGKEMNWKNNSLYKLSIDRINQDGNYVEGEIQLVCYMVNIMKNHFTEEAVIDVCEAIALYRGNFEFDE
jgi:hypothetical protein|uniref:Uncharacterized protein n=1 Tax=viral metagenome TaxID=1070528 RepID=A0A6C0IRH1_9ZZZZ